MTDAKPVYAPLPARAIGDQRLTAIHLRALAAIAFHDRLSASRGNGPGCYAGRDTLAAECSVNASNLSTAISELIRFGYLTSEQHPLNRRHRVYRVAYTNDDRAAMGNAQRATVNASPQRNGSVAQKAVIGCPEKKLSKQDQRDDCLNILNISGETEIYTPEGASDQKNVCALLDNLETRIRGGHSMDGDERAYWLQDLRHIARTSPVPASTKAKTILQLIEGH